MTVLTYETIEGDVGGMGHLRVKNSLQFLQHRQLISHIRLLRSVHVDHSHFSHHSMGSILQLKYKKAIQCDITRSVILVSYQLIFYHSNLR